MAFRKLFCVVTCTVAIGLLAPRPAAGQCPANACSTDLSGRSVCLETPLNCCTGSGLNGTCNSDADCAAFAPGAVCALSSNCGACNFRFCDTLCPLPSHCPASADSDLPSPSFAACLAGGPTCGDGIFELGEECDDGNNNSCDGCSAACVIEFGCGDGITCPPEVCDDGNTNDGDGCRGDCLALDVPTMTWWGMAALLLVLLAGVTFKIRRLLVRT